MPRFSVLLLGGLLAGCSPAPDATDLRESAQTTGLWFVHDAGRSGKLLLPEITGSGVGLIDYDSDGDLDVFFAQGAAPGTRGEGNRLFRNELVPTGELGFVDVSATAGALGDGFAMGVSTADIDNDGDTDLFVSGVGRDYLLRNDDSTFVDITAMAGVDDPRWNGSASFADIDNDGDLDLFVTAYVDGWSDQARGCNNQTGAEDYCSPGNFEPTTDRLYRNDGDGRFRDITAVSGIDAAAGAGLGVVAGDFNGDDRVDFYVANDQTANHLWLQTETGRFTEQALMRGSAYNADGRAEASMGVTVADIDGNGADDLFMTHLNNESNTLYLNDGRGAFREVTDRFGLGSTSLPYTGWGANWVDLDHDTDLDLYIVNGSVMTSATQGETPYGQHNQRYDWVEGRYELTIETSLADNGRGAAFGDIDNDGDIDVVVNNNNGAARLYLNSVDGGGNWLVVRLQGSGGNRAGIGARVELQTAAGTFSRRVATDGSYASAGDHRVHFGLADSSVADIVVRWPGGEREAFDQVSVNQHVVLVRGTGRPAP